MSAAPSDRPPIDLDQPVSNPALKEALEAHSRAPTARTLTRMADEMRKSHLLVAFLADEFRTQPGDAAGMATVEAGSVLKILLTQDAQGNSLSLAFTDWDEIRRWTKETVSTLVMPASDLYSWAFESTKSVGVLLNPGGAAVRIGPDLLRKAVDSTLPAEYGHALNGRFSQLSDLDSVELVGAPVPDLSAACKLAELVKGPVEKRDQLWSKRFLELAPTAALVTVLPKFLVGPDLFRYVNARLATAEDGDGPCFTLATIARQACEFGFGLALDTREQRAEWVFTCGDLLALSLRGDLERKEEPTDSAGLKRERLAKAETVFVAAPAESYLPQSARRLLHEFMSDALGLENPSVLLMVRPSQPSAPQLVFSFHPEDFPSEDLFQSALYRTMWFVPKDYPVVAISESSDFRRSFHPLLEPALQPEPQIEKKKPWYRPW
jgi:hypothetical protein